MAEVEFEGATFQLADKVGLMPLMRFAHVARSGVDANDMAGLAAIYEMLQSVIVDEDWERFEEHATKVRADGDDLNEVVKQAIELISQRPTEGPSDSSDGPKLTSVSSADDSSSRVIHRLEQEGRPSVALMVQRAQQARVSAATG